MSLISLPEEVLQGVIDSFSSHRDVASLSLQCRRIHRLCEMSTRRKYRRVRLRNTSDFAKAFGMLLSILKKPRLGLYVRNIELKRSPALGYAFVKSYRPRPAERVLQLDDLHRLEEAIKRLGFESVQKQEKILNMLLQDPAIMDDDDPRSPFLAQALAALLVSVSPMLDSLSFCPVGYEEPKLLRLEAEADGEPLPIADYVFKHFLEQANIHGKNMPFLQNLRAVRFLVDPNTRVYHSSYYQPYDLFTSLNLVRRLPAVASVRVDAISDANLPSVEPPPRSGNYTCITIQHSSLRYPYLVYTIESAKRLEKFTYGIGGRSSRNGMLTSFHPERVFRALFAHRSSLRQLDLDVEGETRLLDLVDMRYLKYTPEEEEHESPRDDPVYLHEWADELEKLPAEEEQTPSDSSADACSLRNFVRLKGLSLGVHILYLYARGYGVNQLNNESFSLVDHLPPNLVSLRIYGYTKGMKPRLKGVPQNLLEDQLAKLMAEKDEKLPRLAIVEGIEEPIPNGETVEGPRNKDKLWKGDTDDEWTDYEYA